MSDVCVALTALYSTVYALRSTVRRCTLPSSTLYALFSILYAAARTSISPRLRLVSLSKFQAADGSVMK